MQLSECEISSLYDRLSSSHRRRLMAFYQVRSLFAQIVEGIILLDRLVHILQQVSDMFAVKVILDLYSAVKEVKKCHATGQLFFLFR